MAGVVYLLLKNIDKIGWQVHCVKIKHCWANKNQTIKTTTPDYTQQIISDQLD